MAHHEKAQTNPKLIAEVVALIQGRVVSRLPRSLWEDQELLEDFLHTPSSLDQIIACAFSEYERKKLLAEDVNSEDAHP